MKRSFVLLVLLISLLAPAACAPAGTPTAAPTAEATITPTEAAPAEPAAPVDIVDTLVAADSFSTLVAALQAAGLVDTLKAEGPFTVFAPTDEAFAKLPVGAVDSLLTDPETLAQDLLYHVVAGKIMTADMTDGLSADTLNGAQVTFSVVDDAIKINDATMTTTDTVATNGVIHAIDSVLLPPAK